MDKYKIYPLGESALTIDFGNKISIETNIFVISLANQIERHNFEGFIECVPAYSTLTIFYDIWKVKKNHPGSQTAFDSIKNFAEIKINNLSLEKEHPSKTIEVPVSFKRESAPDLEFVAATNNITRKDVINIFLSATYRVFMLGFLPGFVYLGKLDEKIATPRKQTPRLRVSPGSVGIAGRQTGIYPLASPGGWQIIGRTDLELFTPFDKKPTLFQAGDLVKFKEL